MKSVNFFYVALTCLSLLACNDRDGQLSVKQDLVLKSKKGSVVIPAGNYQADIEGKSKTEVLLEVVMSNGKKSVATFKVPKDALDQRSISIPAAQSGQPYDLAGTRTYDSETSQPQDSRRSCTYYTTEWQCWRVSNPRICRPIHTCDAQGQVCVDRQECHGGGDHEECGNRTVSHSGTQDYSYTTTYNTDTLNVAILQPGSATPAAVFNSVETSSSEDVLGAGPCY